MNRSPSAVKGRSGASSTTNFASGLVLSTALFGLAVIGSTDASAEPAPEPAAVYRDKEVVRFHAEGVQIYECLGADSGLAWRFREPLALLLKDGVTVGRHFGGPTWQLLSGSTVVGKVERQTPGATAEDIPQLDLSVAQQGGGGEFTQVSQIKRINTRGGAFAGRCNQRGSLHLEPYAADYLFLKP